MLLPEVSTDELIEDPDFKILSKNRALIEITSPFFLYTETLPLLDYDS